MSLPVSLCHMTYHPRLSPHSSSTWYEFGTLMSGVMESIAMRRVGTG
jgi:hypothetical protein